MLRLKELLTTFGPWGACHYASGYVFHREGYEGFDITIVKPADGAH